MITASSMFTLQSLFRSALSVLSRPSKQYATAGVESKELNIPWEGGVQCHFSVPFGYTA
ncbi:MAG: hypothetical protein K8R25_16275 [Methanosarcinales archaeon]|nr:hypothetical protein [Methanosarcinales archaeon]